MLLLVPASVSPNWYLVALYGVLQLGRLWVLRTLGERWTTRILVLPGEQLVRGGPYRWLRHPNYAIVVAEIAILPLSFGAYGIAVTFSILNALLLLWRIRAEEAALSSVRASAPTRPAT
jgi:methyltransferase